MFFLYFLFEVFTRFSLSPERLLYAALGHRELNKRDSTPAHKELAVSAWAVKMMTVMTVRTVRTVADRRGAHHQLGLVPAR